MFLLISLVFAKNYCVQKNEGDCLQKCSSLQQTFDDTFTNIPEDSDIKGENDEIHNIYIAGNFDYAKSKHNFIFCDPSNFFIYSDNSISKLTISDEIMTSSYDGIKKNVPVLFRFQNNFTIDIDLDEMSGFSPIYLEATNDDVFLEMTFYTDKIQEDVFSISNDSKPIKIKEITEFIKTSFKDTSKLTEIVKTYYCISDKEEKCKDYSSYNLTFINSTLDITESESVVIIDTSIPQFFGTENPNFHVIGLLGSTVSINLYLADDKLIILYDNCLQTSNYLVEGKGSFYFIIGHYTRIHSATTNNNLDITFKSINPFSIWYSELSPYRYNQHYELKNKIKIEDISWFYGDKNLSDLFEDGKFHSEDEFSTTGLTAENLTEYKINDVSYFFSSGIHEIPKNWSTPCYFYGYDQTSFVFDDVYSFSFNGIDSIISLDRYNNVTIKPAEHLRLYLYSSKPVKFTIQIDHDFTMTNGFMPSSLNPGICNINGSGKIRFENQLLMDLITNYCEYDNESITFELINKTMEPPYYVCVGQSDLESCKKEIKDIDSFDSNAKWFWMRNIMTISTIDYDKAFITGYQYTDENLEKDVFLTPNAHVVLKTCSEITISKNSSEKFIAQSKTSKLTILYSNYASEKLTFSYQLLEDPTDIDLRIYLYNEIIDLYTNYQSNFTKSSVNLEGRFCLTIRDKYRPIIDLFNYSEKTPIYTTKERKFYSICISDDSSKCAGLFDCAIANSYEEFLEYDKVTNGRSDVRIFTNITFPLQRDTYKNTDFRIYNDSVAYFDIPNKAILRFGDSLVMHIILDKDYQFSIYSYQAKFIIDVKESVIFDIDEKTYLNGYYHFEITSSLDAIELIPSPSILKLPRFHASGNFTIYSPNSDRVFYLFDRSVSVKPSPNWTYLAQSKEASLLYYPYLSTLVSDLPNDDTLSENIVLGVAVNETIKIPSTWKKPHNIFIFQKLRNDFYVTSSNITYDYDGIIVDNLIKFVGGRIDFHLPQSVTLNANFPHPYYLHKYMNMAKFICTNSSDTYVFPGDFNISNAGQVTSISIENYGPSNRLITKYKNNDQLFNLNSILKKFSSENTKESLMYDFICYYENFSQCFGDFFHVSDITSLLEAVRENPNAIIIVSQDLTIPYTTGHHYIFNSTDENIKIKLQDSPSSMHIFDDDNIQVNYSDSSLYEFIKNATIDVELNNKFDFDFDSNTTSSITFTLGSDVLVSTKTNKSADFHISVVNNNYHLYTSEIDILEPIFGDKIEKLNPYCAHDSTNYSISFCTFGVNDTIENIFNESFIGKEIFIAPLTISKNVDLFDLSSSVFVHVMANSTEYLNISLANTTQIKPDKTIINEYWEFDGDFSKTIFRLNNYSSLSIPEENVETPITFQLTSNETFIDLRDCAMQKKKFITILNNDNNSSENSQITVYGNNESYYNFISSLSGYHGISLILNGSQKYLCICNSKDSCNRCSEGINGIIIESDKIISDPGENVDIRIFSDSEISSKIFTNKHNVLIDSLCNLNLTDVKEVNQNIQDGIKIGNLVVLSNISNLLLKPEDSFLDIIMKVGQIGPTFSIELDTFLKLNVVNSNSKDVNASELYVTGQGELNAYDYPSEKIIHNSTFIKVIKGVYIICGESEGSSICSYQSSQGYKQIQTLREIRDDFDPQSKIVVILHSFPGSIDAPINYLKRQKILFMRASLNSSATFLENDNHNMLRLNSIQTVTSSRVESEIEGSDGGALIDSLDSDLVSFGVDDSIIFKQIQDFNETRIDYNVHPLKDTCRIVLDDSFVAQKHRISIVGVENRSVSVEVVANVTEENREFLQNVVVASDPERVKVTIIDQSGNEQPDPTKSKSKELSGGAIAGIVIAVVAVIAIIVIAVLFWRKKKGIADNSNEEDDSLSVGL